jgi:transposase
VGLDLSAPYARLVCWNSPLVLAGHFKESFQLFWTYKQPWRARQHLLKWMNSAMRLKLEHSRNSWACSGLTWKVSSAWTGTRLSNGAVEGLNKQIKSISHWSFGFRSAENFIRSHLSLLRPATAACRTLITLFG